MNLWAKALMAEQKGAFRPITPLRRHFDARTLFLDMRHHEEISDDCIARWTGVGRGMRRKAIAGSEFGSEFASDFGAVRGGCGAKASLQSRCASRRGCHGTRGI